MGFQLCEKMDSMKTTIDIPDEVLASAMRFTGAKTKREAVVKAIEEFNRSRRVEKILELAGTFPDFPSNEELEVADIAHDKSLAERRERKK